MATRFLQKVFVLVPTDERKQQLAAYTTGLDSQSLPCPMEIVYVANNTLGSYGMHLHAYAMSRGAAYDYYIFCEVDYLPIRSYFDDTLVQLHDREFRDGLGLLAGIMQGQPWEPSSKLPAHPESSHIVSARSLDAMFKLMAREGFQGSTADYMVQLVRGRLLRSFPKLVETTRYDQIQVGMGMLCEKAGVPMRSWSQGGTHLSSNDTYFTPYWNRLGEEGGALYDWSDGMQGRLMRHALFVPSQFLFRREVERRCKRSYSTKRGPLDCRIDDWRTGVDCCKNAPTGSPSNGNSRGAVKTLLYPPYWMRSRTYHALRPIPPRMTQASENRRPRHAETKATAKDPVTPPCTPGYPQKHFCKSRCTGSVKEAEALPIADGASRMVTCEPLGDSTDWSGSWQTRRGTKASHTGTSDDVVWVPSTCQLRRPNRQGMVSCLTGQRLVFIGDSVMRYQYLSLVHFLETGSWGPRLVDLQEIQGASGVGKALPQSISVDYSLAHGQAGKTNYDAFYRKSNEMLYGNERCDCGTAESGRNENRHYHNKQLGVSVSFYFVNGHLPIHGNASSTSCMSGACDGVKWKYHSFEKFLRYEVQQLRPTSLLINVGIGWSRDDYQSFALNATWWRGILDTARTLVPPSGRVLVRTTTAMAPWRGKRNDGIDVNLVQSNVVDRVVRAAVAERRATSPTTWGLLDSYHMTKGLPRAHCHVASDGKLAKFFTDDIHFQPFVYEEFNMVLFNMVCPTRPPTRQ